MTCSTFTVTSAVQEWSRCTGTAAHPTFRTISAINVCKLLHVQSWSRCRLTGAGKSELRQQVNIHALSCWLVHESGYNALSHDRISVQVTVEASEVFLETLQRFRKQYSSWGASISIGQVALWINEAAAALCCSPTVESSPLKLQLNLQRCLGPSRMLDTR